MRIAAALFGMLLSVLAGNALADAPVYLIRHAEKEGGADPPLTEFGRTRSERWADMLSEAGLVQVISSTAARTRETGEIIAKRLGIPRIEIPPQDTARVADLIGFDYEGEGVLVVAHTETLGSIMEGLGARQIPELSTQNFDRLFILWPDNGHVVELRMSRGLSKK